MGIGISVVLMALGAICIWAVTATVAGIDIDAIGVILLVVGAVGLAVGLLASAAVGNTHARR